MPDSLTSVQINPLANGTAELLQNGQRVATGSIDSITNQANQQRSIIPNTNQKYGEGGALNPNYNPSQAPAPITAISSDKSETIANNNTSVQNYNNTPRGIVNTEGYERYSNGSAVEAPADAVQDENGFYHANGKTYILGASQGEDPSITESKQRIASAQANADALMQDSLRNIQAQYESLIRTQKEINAHAEAGVQGTLYQSGGIYSASGEGLIKATMDNGVNKIADLIAQESKAMNDAQVAYQAGNDRRVDQSLALAKEARDNQQKQVEKIHDALVQANKDLQTQANADRTYALQKMMDDNTISYQAKQQAIAEYNASLTAQRDINTETHQERQDEETKRSNLANELIARHNEDKGRFTLKDNPDGTQSILDTKTGQVKEGPSYVVTNAVPNGNVQPKATGIPILDNNTKTTGSGIPYIDGTNLKGKLAETAQLEAAKMGIPYVGEKQAAGLAKLDDAKSNLEAIKTELFSLLPKDATGRVVAGYAGNKLKAVLQSNDALGSFNTWRSAAIGILQGLVGGQGSGLRINQAEIALSVANDIPNITDTVGVAQAKIDKVNIMLDNAEKSIFGTKTYYQYNKDAAVGKLQSFHDSNAQNASLLDSLIKADPTLKTDSAKMLQTLADHGIKI